MKNCGFLKARGACGLLSPRATVSYSVSGHCLNLIIPVLPRGIALNDLCGVLTEGSSIYVVDNGHSVFDADLGELVLVGDGQFINAVALAGEDLLEYCLVIIGKGIPKSLY